MYCTVNKMLEWGRERAQIICFGSVCVSADGIWRAEGMLGWVCNQCCGSASGFGWSETFSRIRIRIRIRKNHSGFRSRQPRIRNEFKVKLLWKTDKIWQFFNKNAPFKNSCRIRNRIRIRNQLKSRIRIRTRIRKNHSGSPTLFGTVYLCLWS